MSKQTSKSSTTSATKTAPKGRKLSQRQMMIKAVEKKLARRVGSKNAISNPSLQKELRNEGFKTMSDSTIRSIVHHIRVNNTVKNLIANSRGYYVTRSKNEMNEYVQSLKDREASIKNLRLAIEKNLRSNA